MSRRDGDRWGSFFRKAFDPEARIQMLGRDADGGACHYHELFILISNIAAFLAKSLYLD